MAFLIIADEGGKVAAKPATIPDEPKPGEWSVVWAVPNWVMPISWAVMNGQDGTSAINGIAFNEKGDLLLYRRLTERDWEKFPHLVGIREVWITRRIPGAAD